MKTLLSIDLVLLLVLLVSCNALVMKMAWQWVKPAIDEYKRKKQAKQLMIDAYYQAIKRDEIRRLFGV